MACGTQCRRALPPFASIHTARVRSIFRAVVTFVAAIPCPPGIPPRDPLGLISGNAGEDPRSVQDTPDHRALSPMPSPRNDLPPPGSGGLHLDAEVDLLLGHRPAHEPAAR